jgi:hypothetical protein
MRVFRPFLRVSAIARATEHCLRLGLRLGLQGARRGLSFPNKSCKMAKTVKSHLENAKERRARRFFLCALRFLAFVLISGVAAQSASCTPGCNRLDFPISSRRNVKLESGLGYESMPMSRCDGFSFDRDGTVSKQPPTPRRLPADRRDVRLPGRGGGDVSGVRG